MKVGEIVTLPSCRDVKTATSLLVPVIIPSILEEWFLVLVTHRDVVESCHQSVKIPQRLTIVTVRRRGSTSCLKLAVEEIAHINDHGVVTHVAKALVKQVWV